MTYYTIDTPSKPYVPPSKNTYEEPTTKKAPEPTYSFPTLDSYFNVEELDKYEAPSYAPASSYSSYNRAPQQTTYQKPLKPVTTYDSAPATYKQPATEPTYKPAEPAYQPPEPTYKPEDPVYKPAEPAYAPAEPAYEAPEEDQYDAPIYYKRPAKPVETKYNKPEPAPATEKPTPGPTYYKPIEDMITHDVTKDQRATYKRSPQKHHQQQPTFKSAPTSVEEEYYPTQEFGTKSVEQSSRNRQPTTYKSSFKILSQSKSPPKTTASRRRYDTFADDDFGFASRQRQDSISFVDDGFGFETGFLDDGHFASDVWDMFSNDGWGQKIQ